jgi:hypothetical protein
MDEDDTYDQVPWPMEGEALAKARHVATKGDQSQVSEAFSGYRRATPSPYLLATLAGPLQGSES